MNVAERFGANLARLRKRADLSQEEVGWRASVHRTEVSQLERGLRVARVDTVAKLAGALEVEYIIKGPSLVPGHPTVGANEWIAAQLAVALGLPVLDHRLVTMGGKLFFASAWMQKPTFSPALDAELFQRCQNRDRAYGVVVFDSWLINQDRHGNNLLVRHSRNGEHLLMLNDHSHLLVSPLGPTKAEDLSACLAEPPGRFVRLPFIRDGITDPSRLRAALDQVEGLSDAEVQSAVNSTPQELLSTAEQAIYADFLLQRRDCLREVLHNGSAAFPNLKGAI